jgi:acyl-coenzyme A synthetase/AMP-(fatty) acid ligase
MILGEGGIEEVLVAAVVRTPVADRQLIDWSAVRGIPVARVFIVDTLPKAPSGKIHRDQLKRQLFT